DMMHEMRLQGREAMVYSALLYLCKNAPWKGSAQELADFSLCGSSDTALRMLDSLQIKGLLTYRATKGGQTQIALSQTQNASKQTQNAEVQTQNAEVSEKESNQRKRIKENKEESECDNSAHTHTREILKDKFIKPNWKEWYGYGKEQGIDYLTCLKSFAYYESVGWAKISNWRATLIYWDLKDKTRR
ncbi:MAG: hypothetical protein MJZ64_01525, partial [Paludibacteraceae bacterium]|nr:hypothetical protein [Paludibacteraceae bacterium]